MVTRKAFLTAAGLALLVGGVATAVLLVVPSPGEPRAGPGGWRVVSGAIAADGDSWTAPDGAVLERDGVVVDILAGSRFGLPDSSGAALAMPALLAGGAEVTTEVPIRVGEDELETRGPARLSLGPGAVRVTRGTVLLHGTLFGPGDLVNVAARPATGPTAPRRPTPEVKRRQPASPASRRASGQLIDARDGEPLGGVEILVTFSHAVEGYPPHPADGSQARVTADAEGLFTLPAFLPHDPRVVVHLQVDHPEYLPVARVIEGAPDVRGVRPFTTISLRRGLTTTVRFLDPEKLPLPLAAVRVESPHDADLGEDSFDDDRRIRERSPPVRYTLEDGTLRVGMTPVTLRLLHPVLHMWDHDKLLDVITSTTMPPAGDPRHWRLPLEVHTRAGKVEEYRVEDLDGRPVSGELIEVDLAGMPPIRLTTGAEGRFAFAPWPRPRRPKPQPPVTVEHPRKGTVTVLATRLWKRAANVAMPAANRRVAVQGRIAGTMRLRTVTRPPGGEELVPVAPEGFRIDRPELSLSYRDADGVVALDGALPAAGQPLTVSVRGFLPAVVPMPFTAPGAAEVDVGDVVLDPGESLRVTIAGVPVESLERARLLIADVVDAGSRSSDGRAGVLEDRVVAHAQTHDIAAARTVQVGGVLRGRRYTYAVEGSRIETVTGFFDLTDDLLESGLALDVTPSAETEVALGGAILGVPPQESHEHVVHERFFLQGRDDPVTFAPYPLGPDGVFGSLRVAEPPRSVEVVIVKESGWEGLRVERGPRDREPVFDFGVRQIEPLPWAVFRFHAPGVGRVPPPVRSGFELLARADRDHEVAILEIRDRALIARALNVGIWELRWQGKDGPEVHVFEISPTESVQSEQIALPGESVEQVLVRVETASGAPVTGLEIATIDPSSGKWRPVRIPPSTSASRGLPDWIDSRLRDELLEPGVHALPFSARRENRYRFALAADGTGGDPALLPAFLTVPAGTEVPEAVVMQPGVTVKGIVLDVDGERLDAPVRISWEEPERDAVDGDGPVAHVKHGEPVVVGVAGGTLQTDRLPPGRHRFTFRLVDADASARRTLDLAPGRSNAIGTITFEETRSIAGRVILPRGEPAPNAIVALMRASRAYRLPQRTFELGGQPFSARSDALGRFVIDGLPLDLGDDLALVAQLDGYTDAVEDPIDLSPVEHLLRLGEDTELVVVAGYADRRAHPDFEFRLEFEFTGGPPAPAIALGPVREGTASYRGVTPGLYRLAWNLVQPHPRVGGRAVELVLAPGTAGTLRLRIDEVFCTGDAVFNGQPLERGWVLISDAPDDPAATLVGRVIDGAFEAPAPARAANAFVALVPEWEPVPEPNHFRGELLPVAYPRYRFDVRKRHLSVRYNAYNLTYELPRSVVARYRDIEVQFPHYVWDGSGFRSEWRAERLEGHVLRLSLVQPGSLGLRFTSPDGYRHFNQVAISGDTVIRLGR